MGHLCEGTIPADRLEDGRDVFGSGTLEDPFRFRPELNYYVCFYMFLREKGHEAAVRTPLVIRGRGLLDKVQTTDGNLVFFQVTQGQCGPS
jgi:hypothetical protein